MNDDLLDGYFPVEYKLAAITDKIEFLPNDSFPSELHFDSFITLDSNILDSSTAIGSKPRASDPDDGDDDDDDDEPQHFSAPNPSMIGHKQLVDYAFLHLFDRDGLTPPEQISESQTKIPNSIPITPHRSRTTHTYQIPSRITGPAQSCSIAITHLLRHEQFARLSSISSQSNFVDCSIHFDLAKWLELPFLFGIRVFPYIFNRLDYSSSPPHFSFPPLAINSDTTIFHRNSGSLHYPSGKFPQFFLILCLNPISDSTTSDPLTFPSSCPQLDPLTHAEFEDIQTHMPMAYHNQLINNLYQNSFVPKVQLLHNIHVEVIQPSDWPSKFQSIVELSIQTRIDLLLKTGIEKWTE